jgi:hypothetical protein
MKVFISLPDLIGLIVLGAFAFIFIVLLILYKIVNKK